MAIFDLESGPLPEDQLRAMLPEFDESTVKLGNATKADTVARIIDEARENHWPNFIAKAALDPVKSRVLAVGVVFEVDKYEIAYGDNECQLLEGTWDMFTDTEKLVGHHIFGFDLPYLVKRSWITGVDVPDWVREGRYWSKRFIDLMVEWNLGDRTGGFISADNLARAFGLEGKSTTGVTGENFHEYFRGDEVQRRMALDYLENDLRLEWEIAERMQIVH